MVFEATFSEAVILDEAESFTSFCNQTSMLFPVATLFICKETPSKSFQIEVITKVLCSL